MTETRIKELEAERETILANAVSALAGNCGKEHARDMSWNSWAAAGGMDCPLCLRARVIELQQALKPFADKTMLSFYSKRGDDEIIDRTAGRDWCITVGDLRRARSAHEGKT